MYRHHHGLGVLLAAGRNAEKDHGGRKCLLPSDRRFLRGLEGGLGTLPLGKLRGLHHVLGGLVDDCLSLVIWRARSRLTSSLVLHKRRAHLDRCGRYVVHLPYRECHPADLGVLGGGLRVLRASS